MRGLKSVGNHLPSRRKQKEMAPPNLVVSDYLAASLNSHCALLRTPQLYQAIFSPMLAMAIEGSDFNLSKEPVLL